MIERFDPNDARWDALQRDFHLLRYEFAKPYVAAKRVLDVACGTGFGSKILSEAPAAEVVAMDRDSATIAKARQTYGKLKIDFRVGDAEKLSFVDPFDVVVSFETIEHLADADAFLRRVAACLTPTGRLLVSSPIRQAGNLADKPANPFHVREWTEPEFEELLDGYFRNIAMFGQWFVFKRGPFPFARTLKSWATALLRPALLPTIHDAWPKPMPEQPLFAVNAQYMVAVCESPR